MCGGFWFSITSCLKELLLSFVETILKLQEKYFKFAEG